jgi:putative flippase GtrA
MKVARYFVVGAASAAIDFGLFAILLWSFGRANWFAAAAASFVVATAFNYALSIRIVFSSGVRFARRHEVMLVFLVSAVGLAVNQSAIWVFYQVAGWNIWIAKCLATATAFLWNFTARNSFIFRESK